MATADISGAGTEPGILALDPQTLKDLEVFELETGEAGGLFELCNLTRTPGGANVLRARMERPFSEGARIRSTQAALDFILAERDAFTALPSSYATRSADRYSREVLPLVPHENVVEFAISAFSIWSNQDTYYFSIVRGVQVTCGLIRALRRFAADVPLASHHNELTPLVEEMRALLARPWLSRVPDQEIGGSVWRILRLDQLLRMHEKNALTRLLELIYEMDALVAMADATRKHGFILPQIEEGGLHVRATGLVHPFVSDAVPNPVDMNQDRRVLFLTGPNMAGKTTYLRAVGTALYLAHLGMGVPAERLSFVPAERLFSSISLSDNLRGGVSYFRAEALRVKAIAAAVAAGHRVVAVMDEPFKGTNVKDALDASLAVIERLSTRKDCLFLFSSHLIELSDQLGASAQIDCRYFEAQEDAGRLRFDYLLRAGVSSQRLGMRVLREEGVFELLDGTASGAEDGQSRSVAPGVPPVTSR